MGKRMKKILIVCHDNLLYGASKSLLDWVKTIDKNNMDFKFIFLVPHTTGPLKRELEDMGQQVLQERYYQPIRKFNNNSFSIKLKNILRKVLCNIFNPIARLKITRFCKNESVALIHSNSFVIALGAEIALKCGIPHVWHIREFMEEDHMMEYIYKEEKIRKLTGNSYPIYISNAIKNKYKKYFFKSQGKIVYNTITYNAMYHKRRMFMQDGVCNIIIVGKITKTKGQLEAIQAVEQVAKKGYKVKIFICGEGPYETTIKEYVKAHQLEQFVEMLGFRNDVLEIRKDMDIALMCSSNEAFGRVTVEGMYYENLVIGKKSAGTEEIISDCQNGLLYNPKNSEELVKFIINMINDKETAMSLIQTAKTYAINTFSGSIYPIIYEIYGSILGELK